MPTAGPHDACHFRLSGSLGASCLMTGLVRALHFLHHASSAQPPRNSAPEVSAVDELKTPCTIARPGPIRPPNSVQLCTSSSAFLSDDWSR